MNTHSNAILASYVTYKELNNNVENKNNPYQIISEFIKYVIYEKKLYSFSISQIKSDIKDIFEFNLPNAVIKSALKKIDFVSSASNENYFVDKEKIIVNELFKKYQEAAKNTEHDILNLLISYVENEKKSKLTSTEEKELRKSFIAYLLDKSNGSHFQKEISCFILELTDEKIKEYLNSVREGVILYTGLNYDIRELGSLKKDLTLYLDMEILFDIIGYNGTVFQKLALDLFQLVREANSPTKKIHLKYFEETKKEIDLFFEKAEEIVSGQTLIKDTVAMRAIINGCQNSSDVWDKQADFYSFLQQNFGITKDEKISYYTENNYHANLESTFSDEEQKDNDIQHAVKLISHINKLRNDKKFYEYTESEFIFVTETRKTQECSRKMIELISDKNNNDKSPVGYTISMSGITNILWYKLNKGFGNKDFPNNVNSALKAQIVLADFISQNIADKFDEYRKAYMQGDLTQPQLIARICALREKSMKPEDITAENLEDNLNFDDDYIKRFEFERESNRVELQQRQEDIKNLNCTVEELNKIIQNKDKQHTIVSQEKDKKIQEQEEVIRQYKERDEQEKEKKELKEKKNSLVKKLCCKVLCYLFFVIIIFFISKQINPEYANAVSITLGVLGLFSSVASIKQDFDDIFKNKKKR